MSARKVQKVEEGGRQAYGGCEDDMGEYADGCEATTPKAAQTLLDLRHSFERHSPLVTAAPVAPPREEAKPSTITEVASSTAVGPAQYTGRILWCNDKQLKVGRYYEKPPKGRSKPGYNVVGCNIRECNDEQCPLQRETYFEEPTMIKIMRAEEENRKRVRTENMALYNAMQKTTHLCLSAKKHSAAIQGQTESWNPHLSTTSTARVLPHAELAPPLLPAHAVTAIPSMLPPMAATCSSGQLPHRYDGQVLRPTYGVADLSAAAQQNTAAQLNAATALSTLTTSGIQMRDSDLEHMREMMPTQALLSIAKEIPPGSSGMPSLLGGASLTPSMAEPILGPMVNSGLRNLLPEHGCNLPNEEVKRSG